MKIIAVLAMTPEGLIGNKGKLPWDIPSDMKHFQQLTQGGVVIMGKNTYFSLPEKYRPLPKRRNIVLTRGEFSDCESYRSIETLLEVLEKENLTEVFLIGGVQLYNSFFEKNLIDSVECSLIYGQYDGDAFIDEWRKDFILQNEVSFSDGIFQTFIKKEAL